MRESIGWALRPDTWRMLAKVSVVLGLETALLPPLWAALWLTPESGRERVLAAQNALRRRALRWILPKLPLGPPP